MPAIHREGDDVAGPSPGSGDPHGAFRSLLAAHPLPMWVHDADTLEFLEVNDAAVARYGYTRAEFGHMSVLDIHPDAGQAPLYDTASAGGDPIPRSGTSRHRRADGSILEARVTSHSLDWGGRPASLVVVHDATEALSQRMDLPPRALSDEATGLINATSLVDRVAAALERRERARYVGVVVVGLPGLDAVAATGGDAAAEALITAVAHRLQATGTLQEKLARLGGGRFAMLCESDERRGILRVAASLVAALDEPLPVAGFGMLRTVPAVGVALSDEQDHDATGLVRDATSKMRHVAERGGGFLVADPTLRQAAREVFETQQALSKAAREGQLRLAYQPVVSLRDGEIDTCEALLRWDRPGVGLLAPEHFVPFAERTEIIVELGGWVIDHAIADAAGWGVDLGRRPRVGINLAVRQLRVPDLVECFTNACAASTLPPSALCVELTESAFVATDDYGAYRTLAALREMGVEVAIDDFGTGYSNLSYLKHLPVDVLKIDRGFVAGLGKDRTDTLLVEAIIGVAHGLGIRVVGEGVETESQLDVLRALGCDAAQGYLLARPAPAAGLAAAMQRARRVATR